ncbi:MAG TPA: hypothetical protein DCO79_10600 [Spirochaeta sp.]|nr:hypothetical protein [Spirochaeta sp.]
MSPSAEFTWRIKVRKLLALHLLIFTILTSAAFAEDPRFLVNSGHTDTISSLDYLEEDNLLLSGSYDGTIKVWNSDGQIKYQLQISHMPVRKVAACPGKPIVAVIAGDGINSVNLTVWNWQTGELIFREMLAEMPLFIKFSPQGNFLVYSKTDWDSLVFLDSETGNKLNLLPEGFGIVSSVFISDSEKTLLTYNNSGSIQYWDLRNGTRKTKISTIPSLENISFTSNGRYMTGYSSRELLLIDLLKGSKIKAIPAEDLAASFIDQSTDKLVWVTRSPRDITVHSASISGSGFGFPNDTKFRNFNAPTAMLSADGIVFTAYETGAIYTKSEYSDDIILFAENNLLEINDFAINETALAITAPGKLLSISSDFFTNRSVGIIDPETASRFQNTDRGSRYGISAGRGSDFIIWESESKVGGSIRLFDSVKGTMTALTDITAPLVSAEYDSNKLLTLDKNGECKIIDYVSGDEDFNYTSYGLRTVDFIDGRNIIAGRNSSSTLKTPLLHINTRTGETVPVEDNNILVFDLEYDELTRSLYTLGFEKRNGVMRTVLKQHTGRNHDRAETILAFPGENIGSSFTSDSNSSKIFTSLGYGGVKMLYWGGFTSLEKTFSIPKILKLRGNLLASLNKDSSFTIFNPSNGAKVMDLFIFKDLSWAALLEGNVFYASPGAENYINIYDGNSATELRKTDYKMN